MKNLLIILQYKYLYTKIKTELHLKSNAHTMKLLGSTEKR